MWRPSSAKTGKQLPHFGQTTSSYTPRVGTPWQVTSSASKPSSSTLVESQLNWRHHRVGRGLRRNVQRRARGCLGQGAGGAWGAQSSVRPGERVSDERRQDNGALAL